MYCKKCTIFFKVFKLKWIVRCFLSHLQNGTTILTAPLRDVWWFPQIRIPLGITFATEGWGNWRTKIWWFVMGGWGWRWSGLRDTPWFIICPIIKNSFVIACVKVCTFSCKLCVLSQKKLFYLSIFFSKFCWIFSSSEFVLVGVFGRSLWIFFYFCDCPTFPPFSLEKFILSTFYYYFH